MAKKMAQSTEPLDAQSIGNGLYGLQGMSSDVREVREVLAQMVAKFAQSTEPLDAQAIGNGLYGLRGHSLSSEWAPLLSEMLSLRFLTDRPALRDVRCVLQSCVLVSFDRQTPLYTSLGRLQLTSKFDAAIETLRDSFKSLVAAEAPSGAFQSDAEVQYAKAITDFVEDKLPSRTSVTFNVYLDCFEADAVVRFVGTNGREMAVNIEIDGPHHKRSRTKRFCSLRDEYLEGAHSVKVIRIDLLSAEVQRKTPHAVIAKELAPYCVAG